MNQSEAINWKTFKEQLAQNPELTLQFQYAETNNYNNEKHFSALHRQ